MHIAISMALASNGLLKLFHFAHWPCVPKNQENSVKCDIFDIIDFSRLQKFSILNKTTPNAGYNNPPSTELQHLSMVLLPFLPKI